MPSKNKSSKTNLNQDTVEDVKRYMGIMVEDIGSKFDVAVDRMLMAMESMERRFDQRFTNIEQDLKLTQAAVKSNRDRIDEVEEKLAGRIDEVEERLVGVEERLVEKIDKVGERLDVHEADIADLKSKLA